MNGRREAGKRKNFVSEKKLEVTYFEKKISQYHLKKINLEVIWKLLLPGLLPIVKRTFDKELFQVAWDSGILFSFGRAIKY